MFSLHSLFNILRKKKNLPYLTEAVFERGKEEEKREEAPSALI